MKARRVIAPIAIGLLVAVAYGDDPPPLPQPVLDTLGAIDTAPTTVELNAAFMGSASTTASSLATITTDTTNDLGVRLRAIHALGQYCPLPGDPPPCVATDPSHTVLVTIANAVMAENLPATGGPDVLVLRAAIETLGPLQVQSDAPMLTQLLNHASRDIRASAANALRDLCNTDGTTLTALRTRLQHETVDQVSLAINDALQVLGQCTPP